MMSGKTDGSPSRKLIGIGAVDQRNIDAVVGRFVDIDKRKRGRILNLYEKYNASDSMKEKAKNGENTYEINEDNPSW